MMEGGGVGGGGDPGAFRGPPLYNFKTAHTTNKITQDNVLIISNILVYFDWQNDIIKFTFIKFSP